MSLGMFAMLLVSVRNVNPLCAELSLTGSDERASEEACLVACRTVIREFHVSFV